MYFVMRKCRYIDLGALNHMIASNERFRDMKDVDTLSNVEMSDAN